MVKIFVVAIETDLEVLPADLQSKIKQAVKEAVSQPGLSPIERKRLHRERVLSRQDAA